MCELSMELFFLSCAEDERTSLLSWVSRTATPASTLPTVNEINIVEVAVVDFSVGRRNTLRQLPSLQTRLGSLGVLCFEIPA
jgi:hypothetical protein